jgi:tripartite-type tricarboxylate transporter receptor subunit TctC
VEFLASQQIVCQVFKNQAYYLRNYMSIKKLFAVLLLAPALAFAWEPTKPVTVYIGNTPGAGNEMAFRKLADIVQKQNPKFVYVVQNIPGADSVIANNRFLEAPNDGYTINLPSHMSSYVTNDIWQKNIKKYNYDSFIDVLTMGKSPLVLVASPKSGVNTPQEFVKYIQSGRSVNVATGGGAHRTAFEYLMEKGKGNKDAVKSVSFNGPMPAVTSAASYDGKTGTEFAIIPIAVAKALVDAGKVKPIGFTGTQKMAQFPNVPLLRDVAPGINVYAAWSIQLPPGTDKEIVTWYQQQFAAAVRSREYAEYREANVIFYAEDELTPAGLKKHMDELRAAFIPVLSKIDLSKE